MFSVTPRLIYHWGKSPLHQLGRGWVVLRTVLKAVEKERCDPIGNRTSHYTHWAIRLVPVSILSYLNDYFIMKMSRDLCCTKHWELLQRRLGKFMLTHFPALHSKILSLMEKVKFPPDVMGKFHYPFTGIRTKLRTRKLGFPSHVQTWRQAAALGSANGIC
jgi:hypothetical protein